MSYISCAWAYHTNTFQLFREFNQQYDSNTPYIIERKLNGIWCESLDADRRNVTRMLLLLLMLVPMLVMHLPVSDFILDRRRIRVSSVDTSFISTSHEI